MNEENGKTVRNWSYQEGKALISMYENRKAEYFKCRKKKIFWETILTDLEALDILQYPTTAEQVEVKWRSLYRAYKNAKDRGTGTSTSKFLYLDDMDAIFHDSPTVHSNNVVPVGINETPSAASASTIISEDTNDSNKYVEVLMIQDEPHGEVNVSNRKKRRKENFLEKKNYYAEKLKEKMEMRKLFEKYLQDKEAAKEKRHQELMEFLKKKDC